MKINNKIFLKFGALLLITLVGAVFTAPQKTHAAPATFTVNSVNDGYDVNTGDGICETATPGECTLRAAINQANANGNPSEQDVIEFNIPGAGPHTIAVGTDALIVYESVYINGYSEPGAVANTASNPSPMNGSLMIEVDGNDSVQTNGVLTIYSSDVTVRGLVINRGRNTQILTGDYENVTIAGNYIGTDVSGNNALYNSITGVGASTGINSTNNLTVGGPQPEDRNVITGSDGFGVGEYGLPVDDPDIPDNIIVQGNNFFVGADSATSLASGMASWSSVGFRNIKNLTFGGDVVGEGNLVSNSPGSGVTLSNGVKDAVIAGNHIVGNGGIGVWLDTYNDCCGGTTSDRVQNIRIGGTSPTSRNVILNNGNQGIGIQHGQNVNVIGNYIGANEDGVTGNGNAGPGVTINESEDVTIGTPAGRNIIIDNGGEGIQASNSVRTTIQNNYIGIGADGSTSVPNNNSAIYLNNVQEVLVGGTGSGDANLIRNAGPAGGDGVTLVNNNLNDVTILGNSIYDNPHLGIDLEDNGVTNNDELDPDSGANDLLNFPRVYDTAANGSDTDVSYYLDVPAGDYRIEFFSNVALDGSGHGEGQTFIGSQTVTSNGSGQQSFTATISGNSHANVVATATEINADTFSGFGPTSEFGDQVTPPTPVADIGVTKTLVNPEDVAPGATLTYNISYTNRGPESTDLSGFSIPLGSAGFITDFVSPDLTPLHPLAPGPLPDSSYIDVGNNDLTCIWGGPGSSTLIFGETVHT